MSIQDSALKGINPHKLGGLWGSIKESLASFHEG